MNKPVAYFRAYVKSVGGRAEAAKRLDISVGMVGHIETKRRGISAELAMAVETDSNHAFTRAQLRPDLWGDSAMAA